VRAGVRQSRAITFAGSQGHFELNVFNPVMALQLPAVRAAASGCKRELHQQLYRRHRAARGQHPRALERSLMLVTALTPKSAMTMRPKSLRRRTRRAPPCGRKPWVGLRFGEDFDRIVDPNKMIGPEA